MDFCLLFIFLDDVTKKRQKQEKSYSRSGHMFFSPCLCFYLLSIYYSEQHIESIWNLMCLINKRSNEGLGNLHKFV